MNRTVYVFYFYLRSIEIEFFYSIQNEIFNAFGIGWYAQITEMKNYAVIARVKCKQCSTRPTEKRIKIKYTIHTLLGFILKYLFNSRAVTLMFSTTIVLLTSSSFIRLLSTLK